MKNLNLILIIVIIGIVGFFYYRSQSRPELPMPMPEEEVVEDSVPTSVRTRKKMHLFDNVYTDTVYGFEMSYPDECEPLVDDDNLYGWPNGIVLFYCGGQAYAVAVEAWDTEEEYLVKYPGGDVFVEMVDGLYITVSDMGLTETSADVVSTFRAL